MEETLLDAWALESEAYSRLQGAHNHWRELANDYSERDDPVHQEYGADCRKRADHLREALKSINKARRV